MRLRNWKETVAPTIIDTLEDVHPSTLDEPFHWYARIGSPVWVKPADGKWRHGQVVSDEFYRYAPDGRPDRQFGVCYSRKKIFGVFVPIDGVMKPDTPEVRVLLREAGYFI